VDHLVPGSKESRIADSVAKSPVGKHVLIVGHPFVDIWAAVKPQRLGHEAWPQIPRDVEWKHGVCQRFGMEAWPQVPRNIEWKKGVCQHLGWPHRDQADIARAWKHILGGVDDLADHLVGFKPGPQRRVGVLVDHLVRGSKESRIADAIRRGPHGANVHIVGHPFIDIWQAVKPDRLGLRAWPTIPRNIEWKKGVCQKLGWPHRDQADIARAWKHILGKVTSYADLEPTLLGRLEELIDFVTAP